MIHRDHRFVLAKKHLMKKRVGGEGTMNIKAALLHGFDRGSDGGDLFITNFSTFARMRV